MSASCHNIWLLSCKRVPSTLESWAVRAQWPGHAIWDGNLTYPPSYDDDDEDTDGCSIPTFKQVIIPQEMSHPMALQIFGAAFEATRG